MQLISPYGETEAVEILPWSANNQERGLAFVKFCYRDDAIQAYLVLEYAHLMSIYLIHLFTN
jgi:hypothetical protein